MSVPENCMGCEHLRVESMGGKGKRDETNQDREERVSCNCMDLLCQLFVDIGSKGQSGCLAWDSVSWVHGHGFSVLG